jgi:hypothetical protein
MNKIEVKTPVLVVVAVCVVGLLAFWGVKTVGQSGNLDHGQVQYTPGVPPWLEKDPAKRATEGGTGRGSAGSTVPTK